jgi:hypothetical protein
MTTSPETYFAKRVRFSAFPSLYFVRISDGEECLVHGFSAKSFEDALDAFRLCPVCPRESRVLWLDSNIELREGVPQ